MATHSSVLAWRIPGMGEPSGLPSLGSHRVGHDWNDLAAVAVAYFITYNFYSLYLLTFVRLFVQALGIHTHICAAVLYLVMQSCLTVCDPVDCNPTGSFIHGDSPGKNIEVGCHALLQGIFPTQVSPFAGRFFWATREAHEYWIA